MRPVPSDSPPIIRVKLKCKDLSEFLALLAPGIARGGVFVTPYRVLPLGSRVKLRLEFTGGVVGVAGEAVVLRHAPSKRGTGMALHLVRLDPDSAQFPLVSVPLPPAPSAPSKHAPTTFEDDSILVLDEPHPLHVPPYPFAPPASDGHAPLVAPTSSAAAKYPPGWAGEALSVGSALPVAASHAPARSPPSAGAPRAGSVAPGAASPGPPADPPAPTRSPGGAAGSSRPTFVALPSAPPVTSASPRGLAANPRPTPHAGGLEVAAPLGGSAMWPGPPPGDDRAALAASLAEIVEAAVPPASVSPPVAAKVAEVEPGEASLLASAPAPVVAPASLVDSRDTDGQHANSGNTGKRRQLVFIGGAAAALMAIIASVALWSHRQDSAAIAAQLTLADERIAAGRLAGPSGDEALDHLLSARALRPDDPRVMERLNALAAKFEQLGDLALERGDAAEAAAHYQGAVLAEPGRSKASSRLKELELRVRSGTPTN